MTAEAVLVLLEPGELREYRGHNSGRKLTARVGRVFEVHLNGQLIGFASYDMQTRERRSGQRTYVDARWQSPGWTSGRSQYGRQRQAYSRAHAVEQLVREAERNAQETATGAVPHPRGTVVT